MQSTNEIQSKKWYFNEWFVMFSVLTIWPVGIFLAIKSPNKFSFKKLMYAVGGFIILILLMPIINKIDFLPSCYGTYKPYSDDYIMKDVMKNQDVYLDINKNGNIYYHAELSGMPSVDNEGTFTKEDNTLNVNWNSGRLPSTLILNSSMGTYTINISGTKYKK